MMLRNLLRSNENALPLLIVSGTGLLLVGLSLLLHKAPVELVPTRTGEIEGCLTCHTGIESISASHSIEAFGCVSCHGGQRLSQTQDEAHFGLIPNPASLNNAQQFCGECHPAQVATVQRSIMTTYSGAISLIRRSFGLQPDGTAQYAIDAIDHLPAFSPGSADPLPVQHFATNCLNCHTDGEPVQTDHFYRGTGCATCHVLYSSSGLYAGGDPAISKSETGHPQTHQFTTAIPYTQCNTCHNRGNYDLRTMTFKPRADMPAPASLTEIEKRVHDYYQPIGKFTRCEWELDCIDCHTTNEIMGDGHLYNNRSEAQYIQCQTCHGTLDSLPLEQTVLDETEPAMTRANLNPYVDLSVGDSIMVTERGEPLYHIRKEGNTWVYTGKATGISYSVPLVTGSQCQQNSAEQNSSACHECHAYNRNESPG